MIRSVLNATLRGLLPDLPTPILLAPRTYHQFSLPCQNQTFSYSFKSNSLPCSPSNRLTNVLNTSRAFVSNSFRPCITSSFNSAPSIRMSMILLLSVCLYVLTWECALTAARRRISIAGKRLGEGQRRSMSARTGRRGSIVVGETCVFRAPIWESLSCDTACH